MIPVPAAAPAGHNPVMTDATLLRAFVDGRSQTAFAELVDRHGGLVHSAARRLAPADADDVAQAVFLLLARRAPRLLGHRTLAGWLYETTRLCAANARRARGRRAALTLAAAEAAVRQPIRPSTDAALDHLDDGLARLSDGYRQVLLLRYMEGLTVDQTADRLGLTAAAVMKRSTRGLAKLRDFLARRGLAVDASAVAGSMVAQVSGLSDAHRTALAAAGTGTAAGASAVLARSAVRRLQVGRGAAGVGTAAAVAAAAWVALDRGDHRPPPAAAPLLAAAGPAVAEPPVAANTAATPRGRGRRVPRRPGRSGPRTGRHVPAAGERGGRAGDRGPVRRRSPRRRLRRLPTATARAELVDHGRRANHPVSATVETLPAIDADEGHVLLRIEPAGGHWWVTSARYTDADARFAGVPVTGPAKAAGGDRFDYGPAADRWAAFWAAERAFDFTKLTEADMPALIAGYDRVAATEAAFFDALTGSPITMPADDVRQSIDAVRRVQAAARQRGLAGVRDAVAGFRSDPAVRAIGERVVATGQAVTDRAAAQAQAHHTDARPAAVDADRVVADACRRRVGHDPRPARSSPDGCGRRPSSGGGSRSTTSALSPPGTTPATPTPPRPWGPQRKRMGACTRCSARCGSTGPTARWRRSPTGIRLARSSTGRRSTQPATARCGRCAPAERRDGTPGIKTFIHFGPDGREHEYHISGGDTVDQEWTADAVGEHQRFRRWHGEPSR